MRRLRIAICQLECHPAIYASHIAYPEEPFLPIDGSLSVLGTKGLDVGSLQLECLQKYTIWQDRRVAGILAYLDQVSPAPDLVLFPEGSIPVTCLTRVYAWSAKSGAFVLAGSHSPLNTSQARRHYKDIGISAKTVAGATAREAQVLPIIRQGKVTLVSKALPSILEHTVISTANEAMPTLHTFPLRHSAGDIRLLPLNCSEALQIHNVGELYNVVGIVAFDSKPNQFRPYISQQVSNKKIVGFCNDGKFGGSAVSTSSDSRWPDLLRDAFPNGLPVGDAVLIVDVDLDAVAVQVGTADPATSLTLVSLVSVVTGMSPNIVATAELERIAKLGSSEARASALKSLLSSLQVNPLQQVRINFLQKREASGASTKEWWQALGHDLLLGDMLSLRELEGQLAATCADGLSALTAAPSAQTADTAPVILRYMSQCRQVAGLTLQSLSVQRRLPPSIVDRDSDARAIHTLLDDSATTVIEVAGLTQIGKTAVIEKALAESGIQSFLRVPLNATSSPDYVLYSILLRSNGKPAPPYSDPANTALDPAVSSALAGLQLLIFEDSHNLLNGPNWRDESFGPVFRGIIEAASAQGVKIIFEVRRELPLDLPNPAMRTRHTVRGLSNALRDSGVSILDAQLRKAGSRPGDFDRRDKEAIVDKLGGHPVAIALAASVVSEEGTAPLLASLKDRKGSIFLFVHRLVEGLSVSDQERTILQLLSLARSAIPPEVIYASVDFPAAAPLRNLVAMGVLEESSASGHLEVAGILRDYFDSRDLAHDLAIRFHSVAADAFAVIAKKANSISAAVDCEYHAGLAGKPAPLATKLVDGAFATASKLFEQERFNEAGDILETLLRGRKSLDVLRLAALTAGRQSNYGRAVEYAREVFNRNPRDARLLAELARIAMTQFQADRADQLIAIAQRAGVEDVSVLLVEGQLRMRKGSLPDARKALERACELTRDNPWPYYYLGKLYVKTGDLTSAISVLHDGEEFIYAHNIRSRRALNAMKTELGLAYLLDERADLAAPIIESLLEEDPNSPEVIRAYAVLTIKRKGIARARDVLEELKKARIRNNADRCQFHLFCGLFYLGVDDPMQAAAEFEKAHAADRSNVFVMMRWARTLYELGVERWNETDDSHKAYLRQCAYLVKKILEFDKDNPEGLLLLNKLHTVFNIDV